LCVALNFGDSTALSGECLKRKICLSRQEKTGLPGLETHEARCQNFGDFLKPLGRDVVLHDPVLGHANEIF
jgi:hypothetical protein